MLYISTDNQLKLQIVVIKINNFWHECDTEMISDTRVQIVHGENPNLVDSQCFMILENMSEISIIIKFLNF